MAKYRVIDKAVIGNTHLSLEAAQMAAIQMAEKRPSSTFQVMEIHGEAKAVRATYRPYGVLDDASSNDDEDPDYDL